MIDGGAGGTLQRLGPALATCDIATEPMAITAAAATVAAPAVMYEAA
ncbi:MAG: hypothetical protein WAV00_10375 [Nocardioides sp.]